jgi:hypothetical protein
MVDLLQIDLDNRLGLLQWSGRQARIFGHQASDATGLGTHVSGRM